MNYILFDDKTWNNLLPLTFTRPVSEIRSGILTIKEKWEKVLDVKVSYLTKDYLQEKFRVEIEDENILINSSLIPNKNLVDAIKNLATNEVLKNNKKVLAIKLIKQDVSSFNYSELSSYEVREYTEDIVDISWPWDIFKLNGENIQSDFDLLTKNRQSSVLVNFFVRI